MMSIQVTSNKTPYLAGLDGLRAISVLGVMIYHLDISWLFPGGFLGVDVFFALSGFLITSLIIREISTNGSLSFRRFYVRRMMRLFPVVIAMLTATWLACLLFARDALPLFKQDFPAAAAYASNWWQIYSGQSYFEQSGRPRLLLHLWSLSIEEQFYIVWPMFLVLFFVRWGRGVVAAVIAFFAIAVTLWMGVLSTEYGYPLDADPSRAYLGTDTHTMGLFVGALLAMIWFPWAAVENSARQQYSWFIDIAGYVMMAALVFIMLTVTETEEKLYQGGFLFVALLSAGLIYVAGNESLTIVKLLGSKWLRWFGKRSYSLYIWHWPIFSLLRPGFELPEGNLKASLIRFLITFVIAELSYRYVEQPFRYNCGKSVARFTKFIPIPAMMLIGVFYTTQFPGIINNNSASPDTIVAKIAANSNLQAHTETALGLEGQEKADSSALPSPTLANVCVFEKSGDISKETKLTLIGDSVLLGAESYISRHIANVYIDSKVGRQGSEGLAVIRELRLNGRLGGTVLLHLGTNGYLAEKHMRAILHELEGKKVIMVNAHAPRRWVDVNNELLIQLRSKITGFTILDWSAISAGHEEYFVHDGIHLTGKGIQKYTEALSSALGVPFYADNCAQKVFGSNRVALHHSPRNPDARIDTGVDDTTPFETVTPVAKEKSFTPALDATQDKATLEDPPVLAR